MMMKQELGERRNKEGRREKRTINGWDSGEDGRLVAIAQKLIPHLVCIEVHHLHCRPSKQST